jgi:thiamine biosynthesis protein ThiS
MSDVTERISLTLNGEVHATQPGTTVAGLVGALGLDTAKVAVERNREIVPRSTYDTVMLAAGDALEIVHFIGGG